MSLRTRRPTVTTACLADRYHGPHERIIEFSYPDGSGGLISFRTNSRGENIIDVYNTNGIAQVYTGQKGQTTDA